MEMTKKNKIKNALVKASAFAAAASTVASAAMVNVFAFGTEGDVTVEGSDANASTMMGRIIGILLTITRYAGVALVVYGVYEIIMSFMQSQPEAKTKGIIMALSGVVMVTMKSILQNLKIIS